MLFVISLDNDIVLMEPTFRVEYFRMGKLLEVASFSCRSVYNIVVTVYRLSFTLSAVCTVTLYRRTHKIIMSVGFEKSQKCMTSYVF
jgi:hypothetical protein